MTDIQVMKGGPYIVKGTASLRDADGNEIPMNKDTIALCRCGHSSNKPFCDGSHKSSNFSD